MFFRKKSVLCSLAICQFCYLSATESSLPTFIGTVSSNGINPEAIAIQENTLCVPNTGSNQLSLFDISTSGTAVFLGTVSSGGSYPFYTGFNGNTAYVTNYNSGDIGIIDISNPVAPSFEGTITSGGLAPRYIAFHDNLAYVLNYNSANVGFFDCLTPVSVNTISSGANYPIYMAISENKGYVVNQDNPGVIEIIDMTVPGMPTILGTVDSGGISPNMMVITGTTAYVPNSGSDNIGVIDLLPTGSPSSEAALIGTITSGGSSPYSMAIIGTTGYVLNNGSNDIGIIDISTPSSPVFLATISSGGSSPQSILIQDTLGYVLNNASNEVAYFDISVPGSATFLGTVTSGSTDSYQFALSSTTGYVINRNSPGVIGIFSLPDQPSSSSLFTDFTGPGAVTGAQLNAMAAAGDLSVENQAFYNQLLALSRNEQIEALTQAGSQHKVLQYQIEKLDLLLHKEIESELYNGKQGTRGFTTFGYDNLKQKSVHSYPGYHVDHYYQLIGASHDYKAIKWLGALGASESYERLKPQDFKAKASYYTVWGSLGLSSKHHRWSYGLDGLFGYSFINAKREISQLDVKAYTNHGMWNLSFDAKLAYSFNVGHTQITPYDNLGYIYGHENKYVEHGALGDNLEISHENISMIRNQVGFKLVSPLDYESLNVFVDGAYVYEYYFSDAEYKQRFIGSSIETEMTQTVPTKNYGRVSAGFQGAYKNFDWKLAYTGLYGQALADSAISIKFAYKF